MKSKLYFFILLVFIFGFSMTFTITMQSRSRIYPISFTPKSNANEITILTPENKTYSKPMSGYYPATYGYENDLIGTTPKDWLDESVYSSCSISVYNQKDGHRNVVRIYDANTGTGADAVARYDFESPKVTGTVECWVYKESGSAALVIQGSDGSSAGFQMTMDAENNGVFRYAHAPSTYTEFADGKYADQEWFHLRIDFNCDTDTADYYLNGIKEVEDGSFHIPVSQISYLLIRSGHSGHSGVMYFDAVSFSWDGDYNIGESLNEGLLLSYENATNLDWKGYSIDGNSNITILGNTTIAMPDFGLHTVQMFGNDSFGTTFQSAIRHFSISPINIITPENRTYTQPMSGYYPGTHGFENEEDNDVGTEVAFISRYESDHSETYAKIEDNIYGRNKVLKFYDAATSSNYNFYAYHDFPTKIPYGTVEFWVLNTVYSGDPLGIYYHFSNSSGAEYVSVDTFNSLFYLIIDGDNDGLIKIHTGNGERTWSGLYSDNTWHHIRIDFESSLGGYLGLEQYKLNFWFDGIQLLTNEPLKINDSLGVIASHSHGWDDTRHDYLDAVGFSWDPDYNIGDNLDEGLLLSYDNGTALDWQGYSYDGQTNKTILGNTTIPMPSYGQHTIQVFGNDSLGTIYQSPIRYFSISPIDLTTPENKTYTEPMSGYYPATFGFENDLVGYDPYGWAVSEPGLQTVEVISSLDGHNNVLELFDTESGSGAQSIANNSFAPQTSGIIEFWYRTSGFQEGISIRGQGDNDIALYFRSETGNFIFENSSGWYILAACNNDQWYHIKFVFNCISDTYDFYLDGALILSNIEFYSTVSSLNKMVFITRQYGTSSDFYGYVDALGYSWDPNYNVGDNLNEGLLLSFENTTNLDWMGYSLDGHANKTIMGDTTVKLQANGLHSIQVFGNDTSGINLKSEIRYYTLDTSQPVISILDPLADQYFGVNAPTFNFIIQGVHLDEMWYTIDGGITNITISSNQGSLNQITWDTISHGFVSLTFYASDSFGRTGYDTIFIYKDLIGPTTSLEYTAYNLPDQVTGSTQFTLTATDDGSGVSTIEYKINDGSWTTYTGAFSLSGFNLGFYTITYRSVDLVGNIESEQFLNVELVIPPPDLSFLLYIIIIGAVIATVGILYFKVIRPRTAESRGLKKKNRLEQKRLNRKRLEKLALEREQIERERLEQTRRDREATIQMKASPVAIESVDTKREIKLGIKHCPECGNPLKSEDMNFCYNCGKKIKQIKPSIDTSEFLGGIIISLIGGSISILLGFGLPFIYAEIANSMGAVFLILQSAMIIGGIVSIIGAFLVFYKPRLGSSIVAVGSLISGINIITIAGASRILKKLRDTGGKPTKKKRTPKGISGEIFCPYCHSEVKSGQGVCDYCGNRLDT